MEIRFETLLTITHMVPNLRLQMESHASLKLLGKPEREMRSSCQMSRSACANETALRSLMHNMMPSRHIARAAANPIDSTDDYTCEYLLESQVHWQKRLFVYLHYHAHPLYVVSGLFQ